MVSALKSCRVCQRDHIDVILDFGEMPLANAYPRTPIEPEKRYPLKVALCADCGCVQLVHTVDPKLLFEDYLYTSSTSGTLATHFWNYAQDTIDELALMPRRDFIVGIGGNDGPLERAYQLLGFEVLNVEPAKNIAALSKANGVPTINAWFNEETAATIVKEDGQASLITCNNCFAHIPDVHAVLRAVKILLAPNGTFIFENAYWLDTVLGNHFDQIYHEHCFYWTVTALNRLLAEHNLRISRLQFNQSQGGSMRVFASRNGCCDEETRAFLKEGIFGLSELSTYAAWRRSIKEWRDAARAFLVPLTSIACYGVPAKFTMLSTQLGFTPTRISYAVEDSPIKVGRFTPGSRIPIVDRARFIADPPAHCIITAANYADHIIKSNPQYKGKWIVLTPEPKAIE